MRMWLWNSSRRLGERGSAVRSAWPSPRCDGRGSSADRRAAGAACSARPSWPSSSGDRTLVASLLRDVERLDLGPLERARITWIDEMVSTRPLGDVARFTELTAVAEQAGQAGDHELHVDLLWLVASRSWWVDPGPVARRVVIDAAHRLGGADVADPRVF